MEKSGGPLEVESICKPGERQRSITAGNQEIEHRCAAFFEIRGFHRSSESKVKINFLFQSCTVNPCWESDHFVVHLNFVKNN